jgi:hypothetical protein
MASSTPPNQTTLNPKPNPDVLWHRFDNEIVVLQLATDRFLSLNETGARFWELLSSGADLDSIHRQLITEFDVTPADLKAEIAEIVKTMAAEKIIVF